MEKFLASFTISFVITSLAILFYLSSNYETKYKPSWYGTYYCYQDAMEDGWYEDHE